MTNKINTHVNEGSVHTTSDDAGSKYHPVYAAEENTPRAL
jgi:hypothetical protein